MHHLEGTHRIRRGPIDGPPLLSSVRFLSRSRELLWKGLEAIVWPYNNNMAFEEIAACEPRTREEKTSGQKHSLMTRHLRKDKTWRVCFFFAI